MKIKGIIFIIIGIIAIFGCKEAYEPTIIASSNNYLVVEGYINTGGGQTTIKLSRTSNLKEGIKVIPESGAIVRIEGENGSTISSASEANGSYLIPTFNLNSNLKYRLYIKSKGKEYYSEYLVPIKTPPIDSISWRKENEGVQLYVSTHDALNNTRYYKWDFKETWEIRSTYISFLELVNGKLEARDQRINMTNCWKNVQSNQIYLGSSAALSQNKITLNPITFIEPGSEKLSQKYSILISQYGLNEPGYKYYKNLKKNTEQIGGIFDSQPSEISGNIHCVSDPKELVIGFIMAGKVSDKRIFIDKDEILTWGYRVDCAIDTIPLNKVIFNTHKLFLYATVPPGNVIITEPFCVDCRLRGSNVRPSFWPN